MEYPIFYGGKEAGLLTVNPDGLYWQMSAWCEYSAEGVQRLYGAEGLHAEPFGVFAPVGTGGLSFHRRLSRHTCPKLPELWIAGRECEGFRPWLGTIEDQHLTDAMLRQSEDGQLLAIPTDLEPIPLSEYAPQMQPTTLNGREYLTLELRDGLPFAADPDRDFAN